MWSLIGAKSPACVRHFGCTVRLPVREILETHKDNVVVIEGVKQDSPRKPFLVKLEGAGCERGKEHCHPLCKLNFVHEIKHTDVLILEQFVDSSGHEIPRSVTGLCDRQHFRIVKLIQMAQKAGLMPTKDRFAEEKTTNPAAKFNCYWDEKSIDVQWQQRLRKAHLKTFQK